MIDVSKPTALELKWRAQAAESAQLLERTEAAFQDIRKALGSDHTLTSLEQAIVTITDPLFKLSSDYNEHLSDWFKKGVATLYREREAHETSVNAEVEELRMQKMARLVTSFGVIADRKKTSIATSELVKALAFFLIDGHETHPKFLSLLRSTKFEAEFSSGFQAFDFRAQQKLIEAICNDALLVDTITPGRCQALVGPTSRLEIAQRTVHHVATAYQFTPPEVTPWHRIEGEPPVRGIVRRDETSIAMDLEFPTREINRLPAETLMESLRLARHALHLCLAQTALTTSQESLAGASANPTGLPVFQYIQDTLLLRVLLATRPAARDLLFTAAGDSLIDRDAQSFCARVLEAVITELEKQEQ